MLYAWACWFLMLVHAALTQKAELSRMAVVCRAARGFPGPLGGGRGGGARGGAQEGVLGIGFALHPHTRQGVGPNSTAASAAAAVATTAATAAVAAAAAQWLCSCASHHQCVAVVCCVPDTEGVTRRTMYTTRGGGGGGGAMYTGQMGRGGLRGLTSCRCTG